MVLREGEWQQIAVDTILCDKMKHQKGLSATVITLFRLLTPVPSLLCRASDVLTWSQMMLGARS